MFWNYRILDKQIEPSWNENGSEGEKLINEKNYINKCNLHEMEKGIEWGKSKSR